MNKNQKKKIAREYADQEIKKYPKRYWYGIEGILKWIPLFNRKYDSLK